MQNKFTIGDKVKIVNMDCRYGRSFEMSELMGKVATITDIRQGEGDILVSLDIDDSRWNWSENQLELVNPRNELLDRMIPDVFLLTNPMMHPNCTGDLLPDFKMNDSASKSMTELTDTQKRNLSENAQALVEAGYYTDDLELEDTDHFLNFLLTKFEADYAAQAKAELAARKAVQDQKAITG